MHENSNNNNNIRILVASVLWMAVNETLIAKDVTHAGHMNHTIVHAYK